MLTILLIMAMFGQGQLWDSLGQEFITAFPENIAFYYPVNSVNTLIITALYNDTVVTVSMLNEWTYKGKLPTGTPVTVYLPLSIEEYHFGQTLKTIRINSTYNIAVQSVSQRGDSVQTNVVQPLKNLGTFYSIPSLNYSKMINTLYNLEKNSIKRYSSFRLVIVNGVDVSNYIIIVKMSVSIQYILDPYAVLQLETDGTEISVQSDYKVAVMLTHPCVEMADCRCNMVMNQLYPGTQLDNIFVVPSILNTSNIWLHLTSSTDISASGGDLELSILEAYSSQLLSLPTLQLGSQFISTSYPASLRLVGPGFIIELIPQSRFSACYQVLLVSSRHATALVIAETEYRNSVYIDGDLLSSSEWRSIGNSEYSSVLLPFNSTHIIWHPSTKIAVYVFETSTNVYGGPAIPLSEKPDPFGCALVPYKFDIISTPQTWPESHQNCMQISDELFTPSNKNAQMEMDKILNSEGLNERIWIGLRRNLLTLEWYRQKGKDVHNLTYTEWGAGEPRVAAEGMCASAFPSSIMDFQWRSVPCCAHLKSICYSHSHYFPMYFPVSNEISKEKDSDSNNNDKNNENKQ